jgi:hypothetical protein
MNNYPQVAMWWENEKAREFTKLECGLLGAMFSAIALGLLVALSSLAG